MPAIAELQWSEVAGLIEEYELARASDTAIDFSRFLPPRAHPLYAEVYGQLLARDLEYRAAFQDEDADEDKHEHTVANSGRTGNPRTTSLGRLEHSRAGQRHETPTAEVAVHVQSPAELGISNQSLPRAVEQGSAAGDQRGSQSSEAAALAGAVAGMPAAGTDFLGFRLLAELGRGAFGRVYLAQQKDLASRYVALKMSSDLRGESQTLAQLQHTNIVPVYSVHRSNRLQAVCMPYFGATTLADLLKIWRERESLPESGKELVSTLCGRKSLTRPQPETNGSQKPAADPCPQLPAAAPGACPAELLPHLGQPQGTAILEMLEGLSFIQAVLWIAARLADGLAHAHERGIVHRDLKPANVLLTDEGQPMLLDFSVAEDTKLHADAFFAARVGGTLPYMAPEHLDAFQGLARTVDARSDIYSLGIILYQMLTRRHPFTLPNGSLSEVLPHISADRQGPPPRLRCWNRDISPAVESIVRHCLEPDPAKRYQSAHELRDDLERQRADLPLKYAPEVSFTEQARKWVRRHPRLTSLSSMGIVAAVLACSALSWLLVHGFRLAQLEAQDTMNRFHEQAKTVQFLLNARSTDQDQLEEGIKQGRQALATYRLLDDPSWQNGPAVHHLPAPNQARLHAELEDLLLLVSRATATRAAAGEASHKEAELREALHLNELAEKVSAGEPACQALLSQRAELLALLGQADDARRARQQAEQTLLRTPRDHYLAGTERVAQGRYREALPMLRFAAEQDPQNFWARLSLGICYDGLGQDTEARACYTTSIALWPEFAWTYFNRGLVYLRQNDFQHALADFDRVAGLRPDFTEVYINRALAWQGMKDYRAAIQDLTHALELGAPHTRIYFMRARIQELAGDKTAARRDLAEGLRLEPSDEKSWIARGIAKLSSDLPGALADFEKAEKLNPRSLAALQNQAHVLSKLGRNQEAIAVLDRVIALYPDFVPARAGRGVLRARLQQRKAAHEDADDALARDFGPGTQYQVAGIFALTSRQDAEDRSQALRYLSSALRKGFGFELLEQDKDLDPIRDRPEFRQLVLAARALQVVAAKRQ